MDILLQTPKNKMSLLKQLGWFLAGKGTLESPTDYLPLASMQLVAPYFLYRLREQGIQLHDIPELEPYLMRVHQQTALYLLQERAMLEANAALTNAGIKAIWLKGAAFAHTIYPEPNLRHKADLDVIVFEKDFQAAVQLLKQINYCEPKTSITSATQRLSHHAHLVQQQFNAVLLELHHRLLGHTGNTDLPSDTLGKWLQQTIEFQVNEQSCFTLKPELHFVYICAHAFLQHGEASLTIRNLLDLHLLVEQYNLDWHFIINEVVQLKWTYVVERALQCTHTYFQTTIPPEVFDFLVSRRPSDEVVDRVILKSQGDIRGESVLQLLGNLSITERIQTVWQIALPPQEYMRERYQVSRQMPVQPYYVYRWVDQFWSMTKSIFRRLLFRISRSIRYVSKKLQ